MNANRRLVVFFAVSALLHGSVFWFLYSKNFKNKESLGAAPLVLVRTLSPSELDAILKQHRNTVESSADEVLGDVSKKDPATYLSDKTRRTDKETVSRKRPGSLGGGQSGYVEPSQTSLGIGGVVKDALPDAALANKEPSKNDLALGSGKLNNQFGQGGSVDVVMSDVVQGAETLLNTDEYVFASFFNRLKSEIEPRWSPAARAIMHRQGRGIPEGIYVTEVSIGSDDKGKITYVEVKQSSGHAGFDSVAAESVWSLGKLRNLPKELLDRDDRYRTTLTFVVDFKKSGFKFDTIAENEEKKWTPHAR